MKSDQEFQEQFQQCHSLKLWQFQCLRPRNNLISQCDSKNIFSIEIYRFIFEKKNFKIIKKNKFTKKKDSTHPINFCSVICCLPIFGCCVELWILSFWRVSHCAAISFFSLANLIAPDWPGYTVNDFTFIHDSRNFESRWADWHRTRSCAGWAKKPMFRIVRTIVKAAEIWIWVEIFEMNIYKVIKKINFFRRKLFKNFLNPNRNRGLLFVRSTLSVEFPLLLRPWGLSGFLKIFI